MTKNPLINSLTVAVYIIILVSVMDFAMRQVGSTKSIIVPITMLSLFTLSAVVMGYIFIYQPFQLYFDGKKKLAVNLFLQTVVSFAGITILILIALFSRIFS